MNMVGMLITLINNHKKTINHDISQERENWFIEKKVFRYYSGYSPPTHRINGIIILITQMLVNSQTVN